MLGSVWRSVLISSAWDSADWQLKSKCQVALSSGPFRSKKIGCLKAKNLQQLRDTNFCHPALRLCVSAHPWMAEYCEGDCGPYVGWENQNFQCVSWAAELAVVSHRARAP